MHQCDLISYENVVKSKRKTIKEQVVKAQEAGFRLLIISGLNCLRCLSFTRLVHEYFNYRIKIASILSLFQKSKITIIKSKYETPKPKKIITRQPRASRAYGAQMPKETKGDGWDSSQPSFSSYLYPISTRGVDYVQHIGMSHPFFKLFRRAC